MRTKKFKFYAVEANPIINIDFEDFPSRRFYFPHIDATEIALLFYSVFLQLSTKQKQIWKRYFKKFENGFKAKHRDLNKLWLKKKFLIKDSLYKLQEVSTIKNGDQIFSYINERAINKPNSDLLSYVSNIIEKEIEKTS